MRDYREFLNSKRVRVEPSGFRIAEEQLPAKLFDWQRKVVSWSVRQGRADLFEECGLGKTAQELAWCGRQAVKNLKAAEAEAAAKRLFM